MQLIKICYNTRKDINPLVPLLTRPRWQQAKEITEVLGACEAVRTALDHATGTSYNEALRRPAHVYVPGDGRRPYTSAALALTTPKFWKIWVFPRTQFQMFFRLAPSSRKARREL